jgi:hypothetical protein
MKLLTHNMLACHIKGVKNGFPFTIEAEQIEEREADYDPGGRLAGPEPAVLAQPCRRSGCPGTHAKSGTGGVMMQTSCGTYSLG